MDFYYRKLMGNGTVASKFRLNTSPDVRRKGDPDSLPLVQPEIETSKTHHLSNCVRCYRLKKKCSRAYPSCSYCLKTGAQCEYVNRRPKRHKKEEETRTDVLEPGTSVSIALLVNKDDTEEQFCHIDLPSADGPGATNSGISTVQSASAAKSGAKAEKKHCSGVSQTMHSAISKRIVSAAVDSQNGPNLNDEFLVVPAIADSGLPSAFVHTFFANYEWKYPFLHMPNFMDRFSPISFAQDTFVHLDVYLVMAVGCIVYDANNNTQYYQEYFSDNLIESIVGIISYDIRSERDLETAHLLILLCIYAINVSNGNLIWNIVGFLNRLIIFLTDFTGTKNQCMRKRCFWTIFNLDKELSLMLDKPSQFMPTKIMKLNSDFVDTLHDGEKEPLGMLMHHAVDLHLLQNRLNELKLGLVDKLPEELVKYLSDLDKWRVAILLVIHAEYADLPLLQNFVGLVHLDYYYLLIEVDQLSATESFQFTLQFLSNSFSLLLSGLSDKKGVVGTSLYLLFWFSKFFRVVEFNLRSLSSILHDKLPASDLSLRLADFNSNLQLIINLVKFLINSRHRPEQFLEKLDGCVGKLTDLNTQLVAFNALTASEGEIAALATKVDAILE